MAGARPEDLNMVTVWYGTYIGRASLLVLERRARLVLAGLSHTKQGIDDSYQTERQISAKSVSSRMFLLKLPLRMKYPGTFTYAMGWSAAANPNEGRSRIAIGIAHFVESKYRRDWGVLGEVSRPSGRYTYANPAYCPRIRMIAFIEAKQPDYEHIRRLLARSEASGVWSNFGPVSRQLEETVAELLALPRGRRVVACASGTVALHGLVQLYEHVAGRALRWVVSAFTFYAQRQGPLAATRVLDCDAKGFLDVSALAALSTECYDGIVVTNLFGTAAHLERYEEIAARAGKILLFDSASCFGSTNDAKPFGSLGAGELFSFHHTKPCSFGEGGCAVVPAELEDTFRSLINFGLYKGIDTGARSSNGKMSDVAAAFILDRLRRTDAIRAAHVQQFRRVAGIARALGLAVLVDGERDGALPNLVPILFPHPVGLDRLSGGPLVVHKYYRPVASKSRADALYAHLVCFPCHRDVAQVPDDELRAALAGFMR